MAGAVSCLLRKAGRAFDRRASDGGRRGLKEKGVIDAGGRVMGASSRISFAQLLGEGRNCSAPLPYLCSVPCARWGVHGLSVGRCDF